MKKYLLLIIIAISNIVTAKIPDIVALVNDEPITSYEFEARKKLFIVLNNIQNIDANADKQLGHASINSLIDEQILFNHAKKTKNKVSEEEIVDAVKTIEKRNKMPDGYLLTYLKSNGVDLNSFRSQIMAEIIKMNVLGSISRSVSVSPREVDTAILSIGNKDAHIVAEIYTSKDKKDKTLDNMKSLQKKLNSCSVRESTYQNFATKTKIDDNLSRLNHSLQSMAKDLLPNRAGNVYEDEDGFKLVIVCEKKLNDISTEENDYVTNLISNRKMSQKAMKFFQDLRKKSYIKVMI